MPGKSNLASQDVNSPANAQNAFTLMLRAMAMDAAAEESNFTGDDLVGMLEAETEEEIWEADERPPLNFTHLVGCELEILDFEVKYSRGAGIDTVFEYDGKKMYLLVKCVRISGGNESIYRLPEIGQDFTANTSARFVVTKLWAFLIRGFIKPSESKSITCLVQGTDLDGGKQVIKLRPVPKRPTQSQLV